MTFKYYTRNESDQYSFIRIPKAMMTEELFVPLSMQSKILYGLLLDRMGSSVKNNWLDDNNRAYVVYQITEIMEDLNVSKKKAMEYLNELVEVGLVEKKVRGLGMPSMLYVKNFKVVQEGVLNGNL